MSADTKQNNDTRIIDRLSALEERVADLEAIYGIHREDEKDPEKEILEKIKKVTDTTSFETKVGESGLAWLGNFVLFFGIAFLVQYIQNSGYHLTSSLFGYVAAVGIFFLVYKLQNNFPKMASIFSLNAYLLIFYVTLRLHFFTTDPLINNDMLGFALPLLVITYILFVTVKHKSAMYGGVAIVLLSVLAVVSNTTHFMLLLTVITSAIAVVFLFRYNWIKIFYLAIVFTYLVHFIWFLNNPVIGNPLQAIVNHNNGFVYIFFLGIAFSLVALVNKKIFSTSAIVGSIVVNGIGFSTLLFLYILTFFNTDYVVMTGSVSAFCLLYAVLLQIRSEWKITAALYALYGFVTMSVAAYGIYDFPRVYFFLAIQSLLVVSMAIWFRSRFIVLMNTMLYTTLLIFYLSTSHLIDGVNISFSLAALITARILNWKKDRLTIKTETLRNIYLFMAFVMVLITLYNLIPDRYITLSWSVAAVFYFLLSLILKKKKYRYLALGTMASAVIYLFLVDLAKIELVFRIIALMFLAIVSIGLSFFYNRTIKKKTD